jgi:hypothetical protein
MVKFQEQELPLQLYIIALMQKEERPGSRNRQAAGNQGEQNEAQIWQRNPPPLPRPHSFAIFSVQIGAFHSCSWGESFLIKLTRFAC